ncbi:hypothetical protein PoB_001120200 [Plakobranchus ocellatus]|uniref:Uncharacterized protein n=1 Tax=Plakobranchus ocellatus TaxID=259542 RepID=A0AAV3YRA3_9GAST|nr:hypothetical protein PoB_001120200 [Plakobranchus ocellatus]
MEIEKEEKESKYGEKVEQGSKDNKQKDEGSKGGEEEKSKHGEKVEERRRASMVRRWRRGEEQAWFSGPPSGQGTGDEARTRDRRVPTDLKAELPSTVLSTPLHSVTRLNYG